MSNSVYETWSTNNCHLQEFLYRYGIMGIFHGPVIVESESNDGVWIRFQEMYNNTKKSSTMQKYNGPANTQNLWNQN